MGLTVRRRPACASVLLRVRRHDCAALCMKCAPTSTHLRGERAPHQGRPVEHENKCVPIIRRRVALRGPWCISVHLPSSEASAQAVLPTPAPCEWLTQRSAAGQRDASQGRPGTGHTILPYPVDIQRNATPRPTCVTQHDVFDVCVLWW